MSEEPIIVQTGELCRHILSNGVYVEDGVPSGEDDAGSGNFWCGKNQSNFGPDDQFCDARSCRDTSRECYEAP